MIKVTKGETVKKSFFLQVTIQNRPRDLKQKVKCHLFNFLDNCKYDCGHMADNFKDK